MAMPHLVQMRIIKKRLVGREGKARMNELKKILSELPGYKTGPYGEIRKWIKEEMKKTKTVGKTVHKDTISVKKEGDFQIVLIGPPNIGKSSLLNKLSDVQIKIANYAFTTLKPIPAIIKYSGAEVQLVEIPGLIEGASEDKGRGKALLGVVRSADAIIYIHDLTKDPKELKIIIQEVKKSGIEKPSILACNKMDLFPENLDKANQEFSGYKIIPISVTKGTNLDLLREEIWKLTGLIKVYTKEKNEVSKDVIALKRGSTVKDMARKLHEDFVRKFKFARVTGKSVKFDNQQVGLDHVLEDGDIVEFWLER